MLAYIFAAEVIGCTVGVKFISREDLDWTTEGTESTEEEKEVFKYYFSLAKRLLTSMWIQDLFAQREVNEKRKRKPKDTSSLAKRLLASLWVLTKVFLHKEKWTRREWRSDNYVFCFL